MRTNRKPEQPTPGFSIRLTESTSLGLAMLIAEDRDGVYLPVNVVSTINEGREMVRDDLHLRMKELGMGKQPYFPVRYRIWAHGADGYTVVAKFDASKL